MKDVRTHVFIIYYVSFVLFKGLFVLFSNHSLGSLLSCLFSLFLFLILTIIYFERFIICYAWDFNFHCYRLSKFIHSPLLFSLSFFLFFFFSFFRFFRFFILFCTFQFQMTTQVPWTTYTPPLLLPLLLPPLPRLLHPLPLLHQAQQ